MFQFGKYRNEAYEGSTEDSPDYYFWGAQEWRPSKVPPTLLGLVTEHCAVDPQRSTLMSKVPGLILESTPVPPINQNQTKSQFKHALRQDGWKHAERCVSQYCVRHPPHRHPRTMRRKPDDTARNVSAHEHSGKSSATHRVYRQDRGEASMNATIRMEKPAGEVDSMWFATEKHRKDRSLK